ncbi:MULTISPECIES: 3-hydroxybutyryl-CoA dehydrogenase [Anaerococcus]|jgi:3-hydroxybutyryl-coA dehydrogenase|uniref:3-hydroxybutyryl-CoA dehydrogenase n=1 Tax=Anaerococcus octavius TaxID=54007 RepID=A0A2I1MAK1_9FIRM|nr:MULTISPECIES: 3-hydroxybutyryl-CoA dehydrogenase [Anaerococcus]MBS6105618.1 3-hydroxybutyryl-CoA dehydrogenase [Anaerococcus sp.]MDU2598420.1 3-hydroxybutyryl-CoA dehydrogenase [Anaerococcus sp.]MDU3176512.1 3-hydroxybutyryl-CoA dehydrogenase [Anaerococcus sp.]MDU4026051.1 3-hydroxybutyryl-CoA dehydrogenase [Anaerococcus sp.]MDU5229455.1 3-hydroxybutyryl-CoA dehydrogenase [Anaerococcus sp.]
MKIGVIGAGTMGAGIAEVASKKYEVVVRDIKDEFVERGKSIITKSFEKSVAKERITEDQKDEYLGRLTFTTDVNELKDCDLIVEAASENPEIKKSIFKELDEICKEDTILASNTSSISITEIAAATKRPDKVIGMHFFNPATIMKLVEIIKGITTSDETVEKVKKIAEEMGKTGVEVNEAPGFVVNRILVPMISEGIYALQEGLSTPEGIDTAMKLGANHPMGPLELADLIGLDIVLNIMDYLKDTIGSDKYAAPVLLRQKVAAGELGRKTGKGFYDYSK